MPKKKGNLLTRLIVMASVFMLTTNVALGALLMQQSRKAMKTQINGRMLDIVNTAASMLDGDVLERLRAGDAGTPEYEAVLNTLIRFRDNIGLDYIYYVRDEGNMVYTFGIDPDPIDPADFGEEVVYTDALYQAFRGIPSVDEEPSEDQWGRFYSAFSPVYTSDGEIAAVVGADFGSVWYEEQLNQNAKTIVVACVLFVLIGTGIILFFTRHYRRRMEAIENNLNDLEDDVNALADAGAQGEAEKLGSKVWDDSIDALAGRISALRDDLRRYITNANTQANNMITAMASDYRCVYYADLDKDDVVCYREDPNDPDQTPAGEHFPYRERLTWYAEQFVTEGYREGFLRFIDPDHIREDLAEKPIIAYRYLVRRAGREYYEMIRMADAHRTEDRGEHVVHQISLGLTEIDTEMRESMARNEALARALSVAEEANSAKTTFLSNMSHEIRTPLNAIIGFTSLAEQHIDDRERALSYIHKIGASGTDLLSLVDDVLDVSRIESGRLVLREEEFSFADFLTQINAVIGSRCADKGQSYLPGVLGSVSSAYVGDEIKLKEVLLNVLGNAVKYTPAGGTVRFSVEQIAAYDDLCTLRFVVSDNGIGMSEEFLPKLFDAFSQENDSQANQSGSTGLGMTIVRSIVQQMNGEIEVESQKGVGSTFTITVTLKNAHQGQPVQTAGDDGAKTDAEDADDSLAGLRVLIAEDIEINAELLGDILELEDIEHEWAENGQLAVERFAESPEGYFDAILMDIRMPVMDGLQATRAIRAPTRRAFPSLPYPPTPSRRMCSSPSRLG